MSKKKFSKTKAGNALWKIGDTLKGKTKAGKVLDGILEVAPVPNPIRFFAESERNKKLQKMSKDLTVRNAMVRQGLDIDEMVADQPGWVVPTVAGSVFVTLLILLITGVIDQETFNNALNFLGAFIYG